MLGTPRTNGRHRRVASRLVGALAAAGLASSAILVPSATADVAPGSLDPTFAGGGLEDLNLSRTVPRSASLRSLALLPDGRIVAGGYAEDPNGHLAFTAFRASADGVADPTFGQGGSAQISDPEGSPPFGLALFGIGVTGSGGVVLGGLARANTGDNVAAVARFLPSGGPDLDFDADGFRLDAFANGGSPATGVALAATGSIYLTGTTTPTVGSRELYLARYTPAGQLDTSFAPGGEFHGDFSDPAATSPQSNGDYLLIDGTGRIVVAGASADAANRLQFLLTRFLPTGGVDTSFGSLAGHTVVQPAAPGLDSLPHSAAFGPDGSIYVAGSAADANNDSQMAVARFGAGGQLDRSFGTGGFKLLQTSTAADSADRGSFASSVVIQPNGRIVLVGAATFAPQQSEGVIVRLMPDGSVDTSFGNGGVARVRLGFGDAPSGEFETALGLAGGKLLVSGNQTVGNQVRDAILGRIVLDLPPGATISATPSQPHVGDPVTLSAAATDPDGTVASISWDLNGDGVFGDATGPSVTTRFDSSGNHDVAVQVTDDDQVASVAHATITVPATPLSGVLPVSPVLRGLTIAPGRFAPDPLRPSRRRPSHTGSTIAWSDSQPAETTLTVEHDARGVVVRGRCVAGKQRRSGSTTSAARSCTRAIVDGTLTHQDTAGQNRTHFSGRLRGTTLPTRRYVLLARATNAARLSSAVLHVSFTISRRPSRAAR